MYVSNPVVTQKTALKTVKIVLKLTVAKGKSLAGELEQFTHKQAAQCISAIAPSVHGIPNPRNHLLMKLASCV